MSAAAVITRKRAEHVRVGDSARIRGRYRTVLEVERIVTLGHGSVIRLVGAHRAGEVEDTYPPAAIIRTRQETTR